MRDFGSCSKRSPAGSGQLFVNRIGPDRNVGSDGWFYKVGGRAGTAGAADPAGPFGNGKLRRGTQVLWFFCVFEQATGSCQRTLAIDAPRKVKRGGLLPVSVVGYDNEGRAQPVAGALEMLIFLDEVATIEEEIEADLDFGAAMSGRTLAELDVLVLDPTAAALHRHRASSTGGLGGSAWGCSGCSGCSAGVPALRCRFASFFCFLAKSL